MASRKSIQGPLGRMEVERMAATAIDAPLPRSIARFVARNRVLRCRSVPRVTGG
ncbi:MAG: hypothetical protein ACUVXA_18655 [Candidatus Jordarchaeum sp.]|uniref:hypothetical protein n=1 Tax=Candidatus Jordarchaeum sp. TaxID=2823881 RepID=UPI00404A1F60